MNEIVLLFFGLSPLPGCQWQMKDNEGLGWDPLITKNIIILVVTVTGKGDNPNYSFIDVYVYVT